MSQNKEKLKIKLNPGKRRSYGGYSILRTEGFPAKRRKIESYLTAARQGMINDLAGSEQDLSTAQVILINQTIGLLGVTRCIEEYIRSNTVMKGEEISPSLKSSYLSYNNSIRLNLQALGIEKKVTGRTSLEDYISEITKENKEKEVKV